MGTGTLATWARRRDLARVEIIRSVSEDFDPARERAVLALPLKAVEQVGGAGFDDIEKLVARGNSIASQPASLAARCRHHVLVYVTLIDLAMILRTVELYASDRPPTAVADVSLWPRQAIQTALAILWLTALTQASKQ